MILHPVIRRIARQWAGSSESFPKLIQAMYLAEGGTDETFIRAVQCSENSVTTIEKAVEVACRTALHHMSDWVSDHAAVDYMAELASHWAPEGVKNDPTNLNHYWYKNALTLWLGLH